eukprot:1937738-Heterocapsa_arctica.AAC.1
MKHAGRLEYKLTLEPLCENPAWLHHATGAIVNKDNNHWVALRSVAGQVHLLDSMNASERIMAPEAYLAFVRRHRSSYCIWPVV